MKIRVIVFSAVFLLMWGVFLWFIKTDSDNTIAWNEKEHDMTCVEILEPVIDAGTVSEDTVVSATFHLVNTGNDSLFVVYINPDCMCTKYEISSNVVPKGDTLDVRLYVSTKNKVGKQKLATMIKLNTKERLHKLTFKMNVVSE